MIYHIEFVGAFKIDPPLNDLEVDYLRHFAAMPHFSHNKDPYDYDDENSPVAPADSHHEQPSLWSGWTPSIDGTTLEWDAEEVRHPDLWLRYLIEHFLTGSAGNFREHPCSVGFTFDHVVDGVVRCEGAELPDVELIVVRSGDVDVVDVSDVIGHVVKRAEAMATDPGFDLETLAKRDISATEKLRLLFSDLR